MPTLADHQSTTLTKVLVTGDSGSGKTGALASLVKAGYNLKIVDCDNGLDILVNRIKALDPALLAKVDFTTCTDKFAVLGGTPVATSADAWPKIVNAVDKYYKEKLGPKDILVLDTMTFAGEAALRYILKLEGRPKGPPQIQDWGAAMSLIENLIAMITSEAFACNVIVNSHIVLLGNEEAEKGYPAVLGNKLPPKIGRYFNGLLMFRTIGSGPATARELHTNTYHNMELKNPNPGKVKAKYKIDTALADYFADVRS